LGECSPTWAADVTGEVAAVVSAGDVVPLPGLGHEAIDRAPDLVVDLVDGLLG
jgi:hypothetical protein